MKNSDCWGFFSDGLNNPSIYSGGEKAVTKMLK